MNNFALIDNECSQYIKDLGNKKYLLIAMMWLDTIGDGNTYVVVANKEDVAAMSREEIESAICNCYNSIEDMEKHYETNIDELSEVVAELSFDGNPYCNWEHISNVVTKERAEEMIKEFIESDGNNFLMD